MLSYPTPPDVDKSEWMSAGFLKLHPGATVHVFLEARDEFFHTHPFVFTTRIVVCGYLEEVLVPNPDGTWRVETFERLAGTSHTMPLDRPHRLVGLISGPCITRCEYGSTVQTPGFVRLLPDGQAEHRYWNEKQESDWKPYNPE